MIQNAGRMNGAKSSHDALPLDYIGADLEDYFALLKPRVMSLVVFTGLAGLLIAPGSIHPMIGFVACLAIALASGGAGAVNMWYDRDIDAIMKRTSFRPIPQGRVAPESALIFGIATICAAVALMGLAINWFVASLLALAALYYIFIYTIWLKRRTPQNIVIGGAAGAFPPAIGWACVTGNIGIEAITLFALIFFWTPPHFWALSLYRAGDYKEASIPMLPVIKGVKATKSQMMIYSLIMLPLSLTPSLLCFAGIVYALIAFSLSLIFIAMNYMVIKNEGDLWPKRMFGFTILYLFLLFSFMILDGDYSPVKAAIINLFGF